MMFMWVQILELIINSMSSSPNYKLYTQSLDLAKSVDQFSRTALDFEGIPKRITKDEQLIKKVLEKCEMIHKEMLQAIYGIDKKIKNIQESISFDIVLKLFNNHQVNRFTTKFDNFINGTKQIDYLYTQFMKFYKDSTLYNLKSRQIFIDACFNLEDGLNSTLYFMSKILVEDGGAFNLITGNTVEQHILATRRLSTLEYLYNLVAYFITIEIKAALTITGAKRIAILTDSDKDYEEDYNNYMKFVPLRIISVIISLLTYAPKCSGRYWVYDTHKYRIGHKYVAFNNFLKGFYYRDTSCSYAGQPINSTGSNIDRSECEVENFNSCNGTLHCLPNSETSSSVDICYNAEGKNSNYEYVVLNKTGTKDCSSTKISYKPNTKCIDCFCYCEESEVNAHIYFSLDEMVSDIENNRIITGIRFGKYNGTVTMDIQVTKLQFDGSLMESSSVWVINKAIRKFRFKYLKKQEIQLGEVKADNYKVVTGIRFEEVSDGVQLQVKVNDLLKCSKGKILLSTTSSWIKPNLGMKANANLDLALDNPSRGEKKHPASIHNFTKERIKISLTSFEDDGAQTVIPFFDTREVILPHPLPLRGIGLVYKTSGEMCGGFVAPYIILADLSTEIDSKSLFFLQSRLSSGPKNTQFDYVLIIILILIRLLTHLINY